MVFGIFIINSYALAQEYLVRTLFSKETLVMETQDPLSQRIDKATGAQQGCDQRADCLVRDGRLVSAEDRMRARRALTAVLAVIRQSCGDGACAGGVMR